MNKGQGYGILIIFELLVGLIVIGLCILQLTKDIKKTNNKIESINEKIEKINTEIQAKKMNDDYIYIQCTKNTIISPYLLKAIAIVESQENDNAIGDNGFSKSRFQLYEVYHTERAKRYGEYDVNNPMEAGRISALYLQECFLAFPNDPVKAICAYRQGINGVKINGPTTWYSNRVIKNMNIFKVNKGMHDFAFI